MASTRVCDESGAVIATADGSVAAVAEVCKGLGVPFVSILGIAEMARAPVEDETAQRERLLASAARTLSPADHLRMRELMFGQAASGCTLTEGQCAAFDACQTGDVAALRSLIDGKRLDLRNEIISDLGHDAVQVASRYGRASLLRYLLVELGLDPNRPCTLSGKRALHYATQHAHADCVELLISSKANPLLVDHQGLDALGGICPPYMKAGEFDVSALNDRERAALPRMCRLLSPDRPLCPALQAALDSLQTKTKPTPKVHPSPAPPEHPDSPSPAERPDSRGAAAAAASHSAADGKLGGNVTGSKRSAPADLAAAPKADLGPDVSGAPAAKKRAPFRLATPPLDARPPSRVSPLAKEEGTGGLCVICLTAPADTMVLPCMHCVVCAGCSRGLVRTPDAKICVSCRCDIEHVLV